MHVRIADSEADASFMIFNKDVKRLIDVSASQLLKKHDSNMEVILSTL